LSITCERNDPECFSDKCPIDDHTRVLWMASIVASSTPQSTYTIQSVSQVPTTRDSVSDLIFPYGICDILCLIVGNRWRCWNCFKFFDHHCYVGCQIFNVRHVVACEQKLCNVSHFFSCVNLDVVYAFVFSLC